MQPPYPPPGAPYGAPYPPPQQQAPVKKGLSGCAIAAIVVVVLVVFGGGIFAAVGIYGVRRYLAAAKTAEAKNTIGAIARAATAAYERENGDELPSAKAAPIAHHLCDSATPVPKTVPAATKYQPSTAPGQDFQSGSATAGWTCLKFSMSQPMYYQYSYVKGAGSGKSGATASGFEASARGDIDGNGTTSFFARGADIKNGIVSVSTQIYIENEFE